MRLARPGVPRPVSALALATLLGVVLSAAPAFAGPRAEVDRALALAGHAPGLDYASIAFRSSATGLSLAEADPLLRPSAALLRAALDEHPPSLLLLSAAGREDGPRGPAALHRWRIVLGLRWPF